MDPYLENTDEDRANILENHTYKIVFHNWVYDHYQQLGDSEDSTGTWMHKRMIETIQDVSITIVDVTANDPSLDDFIDGIPDEDTQRKACTDNGGAILQKNGELHCSEGSLSASDSCLLSEFYTGDCELNLTVEPFEECENGGSYDEEGNVVCDELSENQ